MPSPKYKVYRKVTLRAKQAVENLPAWVQRGRFLSHVLFGDDSVLVYLVVVESRYNDVRVIDTSQKVIKACAKLEVLPPDLRCTA